MKLNYFKVILSIVLTFGFSYLALAQTRKPNKKKTHVLATGEVFKCNINAKVEDGIANSIKVMAEKSCDVAIRLVNKDNDSCIRYAFVNAGESYTIDDIPVGKYYVKVGLGKGWFWEDTASHCAGGFKENAIYKKFNDTYKFKKGQVGQYTLMLSIVSGTKKTGERIGYNTKRVSEVEFGYDVLYEKGLFTTCSLIFYKCHSTTLDKQLR